MVPKWVNIRTLLNWKCTSFILWFLEEIFRFSRKRLILFLTWRQKLNLNRKTSSKLEAGNKNEKVSFLIISKIYKKLSDWSKVERNHHDAVWQKIFSFILHGTVGQFYLSQGVRRCYFQEYFFLLAENTILPSGGTDK